MEGIVRAWGKILQGYRPNLSIEITRECPLRCPGCYAYGDEHLGGGQTLRTLSDRKASTINSIAQAMPDTTSRDRFLGDILTTSPYSDPMAEVGFTLNQMSTPAARLEALQQLRNNNRLYPAKISDTQLQQWGLTRQQVEQAAQK